MSVGLSGNLVDFGIADVFQLIGQQRKTGELELHNDGDRVQLVFDRGMVVSAAPISDLPGSLDPLADRLIRCGLLTREIADEATIACRSSAQTFAKTLVDRGWLDAATANEAEELVTRDTIFEVLRWESGNFDFRAREVSHEREASELLGAEQILMDGLRMVDEWQSFRARVPSENTVFERSGRFEHFLESHSRIGEDERRRTERVFNLIDGRLSARRVIDLARLGTFDGVRCLAELAQGGTITPATATPARPMYARRTRTGQRKRMLRNAVAGVVPLCALAAVVWWTAAGSASPTHAQTVPIQRSTLESLEGEYAARAVRQALEAYRLGQGRWPAQLEALEEAGLLDPGALAALRGRPYYSTHPDSGPIFLAPDRDRSAALPHRGPL